jgi:hypothetical protein
MNDKVLILGDETINQELGGGGNFDTKILYL